MAKLQVEVQIVQALAYVVVLTIIISSPVVCQTTCKQTPCGPTQFSFYLHNTVFNAKVNNIDTFNSVYSLPPNLTFLNTLFFGVMATFEDPLTIGPSNTS